jgi:hypothetical protein
MAALGGKSGGITASDEVTAGEWPHLEPSVIKTRSLKASADA